MEDLYHMQANILLASPIFVELFMKQKLKSRYTMPGLILLSLWSQIIMSFVVLTFALFHYVDGWTEYITWVTELGFWGALLAGYNTFGTNEGTLKISAQTANIAILGKLAMVLHGMIHCFSSSEFWMSTLSLVAYCNMIGFVLLIVLYYGKDKEAFYQLPDDDKRSPIDSSNSLFDRLFYTFMFPLVETGMQRPLEKEDAFPLRERDTCKYQRDNFRDVLKDQLATDSKWALVKALVQQYKIPLLVNFGFDFTNAIFDLLSTSFIILLVEFLTNEDIPYWKGPAFVSYFGIMKLFRHLYGHQDGMQCHALRKQTQAVVRSSVYEKGFKTNSTKWETSEIINLFNQDIRNITDLIFRASVGLQMPFKCLISITMLWKIMGPVGSIAALIVLAAIFGLNFYNLNMMKETDKQKSDAVEVRNKYQLELLNNIRILKMYNWESVISENTLKSRDHEMNLLTKILLTTTFFHTILRGADVFINLAMLGSMSFWGITLETGQIFAGIGVIGTLKGNFTFLPEFFTFMIQARTSNERITEFLRSDEYASYVKQSEKPGVQIKDTSFAWPGSEKPALSNVNFTAAPGEFIAVVGKVGTGKTTLLRGITGNMNIHGETGNVEVGGSVAYVEQEPWIQNASLRENILFGSEYDASRYMQVVTVCELKKDIELLPAGDMSEIGEKGINLSGGQKARVSLARAVYKNTDILLLDDPLSAVDVHVGKRIFKSCLKSFCKGKTIIMVTNGQQYLPKVDTVAFLKDGEIKERGHYWDLLETGEYFYKEFMVELERFASSVLSIDETAKTAAKEVMPDYKKDQLVEDEDRQTGSVELSTYYKYFVYSGGISTVFFMIVLGIIWLVSSAKMNLGLVEWISASEEEQAEHKSYYIANYAFYSFLAIGISGVRQNTMYNIGMNCAKKIYNAMIKALLDAPINKYYDITPIGRIINRFTNDVGKLDGGTFHTLCWLVDLFSHTIFVLAMSIYTVPFIVLLFPIILYIMAQAQKRYRASKLEIERVAQIAHTPIMQNVNESLTGSFIIRAFNKTEQFMQVNDANIDEHTKQEFMHVYVDHWLGFYTGMTAIVFNFISVTALVLLKGNIEPTFAAVCFYKLGELAEKVRELCFCVSHVELCMVPFERTLAFTQIESEAPRVKEGDQKLIEQAWPQQGSIQFSELQMRYRDDTEIVLKGIDMEVKGKEKIGICGRTGSGKSSLTMNLFRIVEATAGMVYIDGVDISQVGLDLLRQKLCLIPQDPTLFKGTMRFNLDPNECNSDEQIAACMKDVDYWHEGILDLEVKANGENLSVGQKQQVCLARALLRNSKIMVLDEATASIDYKTDEIIQKVIQDKFQDFTVLTIAHRINTIINYDKIACFEAGILKEFGSPQELLAKRGLFYELVHG